MANPGEGDGEYIQVYFGIDELLDEQEEQFNAEPVAGFFRFVDSESEEDGPVPELESNQPSPPKPPQQEPNMNDKRNAAIAGFKGPTKKADRKNARKSSKMTRIVSRQVGVKLSDEPNEWMVVWGIGVASGVGKNEVYAYFQPRPREVRLFVDQTYVFIRCKNLEDAVKLRNKYHGVNYDDKQTLYIGYVDQSSSVPDEDLKLLIPFQNPLPDGLKIFPEFISLEEEALIIENLYVENTSGAQLKNRTVQHFGYEFRYGTNDVDICTPLPNKIPEYVMPAVYSMLSKCVIPMEPDQLTVNQYSPGQGIPPHCDTHSCFDGAIVSLSLGSSIVMDFRKADKVFSVVLPPRSLLVMDGDSRYGWTHGITPRKWDVIPDSVHEGITLLPRKLRISLTFRRLQRGPNICKCKFPNLCDTQKGKITNENASSLENDLVHRVYEDIASHFTETRHKPWPKVKQFVEALQPGEKLLDIGCANGKYFGINKEILEVGNDMSTGLLMKCHEKGHEVVRSNALCLPFQDNYFEGVISIAVLHHIATKERRMKFLQEFVRVMTPGGRGLIYVWAKEQKLDETPSTWSERQSERNVYETPEMCAKEVADYSFLPIHDRDQEFPKSDMLVPWVNKQEKQSKVHHRYYHVFEKDELKNLVLEMSPPPQILDDYYEQGNWVVIIQKPV